MPLRKFHGRIRVQQNNYYATFEDPTFETANFDEQYRITTRLLEANATMADHLAFYDFKRALENAESVTAVEMRAPEKAFNPHPPSTTIAEVLHPANARQDTPVDQKQARIPCQRPGERSLPPSLESSAQLHPVPASITRTQIATAETCRAKASTHRFHPNDQLVEISQVSTSKKRPRTVSETVTPASASAFAPVPDNLDCPPERRVKKPRTGGDQAPTGQLHAPSLRPAQDNLIRGPEPNDPQHSQNSFSTAPIQQPQRSHSNPNMLDLCVASAPSGPAPHFYQPSPSLEPTTLGSSFPYTEPMPYFDSPAEVYSPPSHQPTTVFATNAQGVFATHRQGVFPTCHQPTPVFATHPQDVFPACYQPTPVFAPHPQGVFPTYPYDAGTFETNAQGVFPTYSYDAGAFETNAQGVFPTYHYDAGTFETNAQGIFPTQSQLTPVLVADAKGISPLCHQATPGPVATPQGSTPSYPKPSAPNASVARHELMDRGMSLPPTSPDSPYVPNPSGQPGRRLCSNYGQGLIDSVHRNVTITRYRKETMMDLCQKLFCLSRSRHVSFDSMMEHVFALLGPAIGENRNKIETSSGDPWTRFWAAYMRFCQQLVFKDALLAAGLREFRETRSRTIQAELVQAIHKIGGRQWVQAVDAVIRGISAMPL